MGQYNIHMVSKLTGIGIHTLRAWESRYKTISPNRSERGRRLYNENEVEKLQLLAQLCLMGRSIGTIANLNSEELRTELTLCGAEPDSTSAQLKPVEKINVSEALTSLLMALQFYKLDIINHEIQKLKIQLSARELALDILSPILREVGQRVSNQTLSIAQEHALSSIIRFQMGQIIYRSYEKKAKKTKTIVLATPEEEFHEFGIMISAILCTHYNIRFYYFGLNLPKEALMEAVQSVGGDIVIIGTTQSMDKSKQQNTDEYLDYCLRRLDKGKELWLGGSGQFDLARFQKNKKFQYISTLDLLDKFLRDLA